MKTVEESNKQIPVVHECDVVVCGGGPAGFAAALSARREGVSTTLIEAGGALGGTWTNGILCYILDSENKTGIMKEILEKLRIKNACWGRVYDPEQMKVLLEEMSVKENIFIQYHTRVVNVIKNSENRITHVITESKSGRQAWKSKVFIDATGDGDVGAFAGCGFDYGREGIKEAQPMTLQALISGIKIEEMEDYTINGKTDTKVAKANLLSVMKKAGVFPSYGAPTLIHISDNLFNFFVNHEYNMCAMDATDVTKATIHGRAEIFTIINKLREYGGIWKNAHVIATGAYIGVREGRRIHGLYTVTAEDLIQGRKHKDSVCDVTFGVDIHSTNPKNGSSYTSEGFSSKPYQIPVRALIAKDVKGLMMAGRCISGDFVAHSSYRVTGNAVSIGEAAGRLAVEAARKDMLPHELILKKGL